MTAMISHEVPQTWSTPTSNPPNENPSSVDMVDAGGHMNPPPVCGGCQLRIVDKFYLCALETKWHSSCLKCVQCGVPLEQKMSCFKHSGQLYCKEDYNRIYAKKVNSFNSDLCPKSGPHQCRKCLLAIGPTDLVMKARESLFHVDCFRCFKCDTLLRKGDLFGMPEDNDDTVYCRVHFCEDSSQSPEHHHPKPYGQFGHSPPEPYHPHPYTHDHDHENQGFSPNSGMTMGNPYDMNMPMHHDHGSHDGWYGQGMDESHYYPSRGNMEESHEGQVAKKKRGRKKRVAPPQGLTPPLDEDDFCQSQMGGMYPMSEEAGLHSHGKSKRARTSFKHHQLRIMRSHFQINQNPDSRELKMLSQKTGLDKKVLQVWFQNSRAKWRRSQTFSEGGNPATNEQPSDAQEFQQ